MKDSFTLISLLLICVAMMFTAVPRKRSYIVTTEQIVTQRETTKTVIHTTTKDSLNKKAIKILFNRETKEILDMNGNVIAIADTFYVDNNNRITKIIEKNNK